jgi:hypothetical protein
MHGYIATHASQGLREGAPKTSTAAGDQSDLAAQIRW